MIETQTNGVATLQDAERAAAMAREAGADDAAIVVSQGRSTEYSYRDGQMEKVQDSGSKVLNAALYVDGRYAVHRSNDLRPASLRAFLDEAVALTRALEPDPFRCLPDAKLYEGRSTQDLDLVDATLLDAEREACLGWLQTMDEAAHGNERVISATSHVSVGQGSSARVTTNGFSGTWLGTTLALLTEVTVQDEGDRRPEAYCYAQARHAADVAAPADVAGEALQRALRRLGSTKGATRRCTLVVDREAAGRLLRPMLGALSAAAIQQGRSFLADALGKPVAAEHLTLMDDPLLARGLASHHFDSEGITSRLRPIIEQGKLATFFVDTYYGRKLGWEPTTAAASNVVFEPGTLDRDGIVAATPDGIYVTSWAGGNADATTGDFSFGLQGHEIRDGRLGAPVGEMNVTGNFRDLLPNLTAVGNDPFPYASLRAPTLAFRDVQFSGT